MKTRRVVEICCADGRECMAANLILNHGYDPAFICWSKSRAAQDFRSVSLAAMAKLSKAKGYRLIGGHRHGFNAFFLREDLAPDIFPEVSIASVHDNPHTRESQAVRWPAVRDMNWVEV